MAGGAGDRPRNPEAGCNRARRAASALFSLAAAAGDHPAFTGDTGSGVARPSNVRDTGSRARSAPACAEGQGRCSASTGARCTNSRRARAPCNDSQRSQSECGSSQCRSSQCRCFGPAAGAAAAADRGQAGAGLQYCAAAEAAAAAGADTVDSRPTVTGVRTARGTGAPRDSPTFGQKAPIPAGADRCPNPR